MNKHQIKKVEEAFKTCFQANSVEVQPGSEWQRNLMINIRANTITATRHGRSRQEIILWRLAWSSLAASLILVAVFGFAQTHGNDNHGGVKWEDRIFAINDIIRE